MGEIREPVMVLVLRDAAVNAANNIPENMTVAADTFEFSSRGSIHYHVTIQLNVEIIQQRN